MKRLAGRRLFTVGAREYRWEDVVLCAHLCSEYGPLEQRTRAGIACQKRLRSLGRELPEEEIDEASDDWRYDRDLLSGDDAQEWLDRRGLGAEEWLDYIERSVLRTRFAGELGSIAKSHAATPKEVEAAVYAEAVCSGVLGELADRLAGQAAVYDRVVGAKKDSRPAGCSQAALRPVLKRIPSAVKKKGVLGLGPAPTTKRAELIACISVTYQRFLDEIAAPAALQREIDTHPLDWTRLDCETVAFDAEEMAREAALLFREDGVPLPKVAKMANSAIEPTRYVLEDVSPPLKDRLVGAHPGELIGPVASNGAFVLVSVVHRVEPTSADGAIRERARRRVVERTIRREIEKRVRWHEQV